jgi:DNA-binding transcriptional LysR family regulator
VKHVASPAALALAARGAMNVHHLELFYYVAKHGGISAAVRRIPYGIQQPAVSGQMRALEESVGARLFERSPFRLTPAGEKLYAYTQPFFDGLGGIAGQLKESAKPELRIGASEMVLRDYIPAVTQRVRARHPNLRLHLRSGYQSELESWLRDGLIDLAIGAVADRPPARLRQARVAAVPLVLLVHRQWPLKSADRLWAQKKITDSLIGLPPATRLMKNFQQGLKRLGVTWAQSVEATSIELVTCYVANSEGHGVNLAIPAAIKHRDVRVLPLDGFDPITIGFLWRSEPTELLRATMAELQRYAHELWPEAAIQDPLP